MSECGGCTEVGLNVKKAKIDGNGDECRVQVQS